MVDGEEHSSGTIFDPTQPARSGRVSDFGSSQHGFLVDCRADFFRIQSRFHSLTRHDEKKIERIFLRIFLHFHFFGWEKSNSS